MAFSHEHCLYVYCDIFFLDLALHGAPGDVVVSTTYDHVLVRAAGCVHFLCHGESFGALDGNSFRDSSVGSLDSRIDLSSLASTSEVEILLQLQLPWR